MMKSNEIRVGNIVMDASNHNYEINVGIDELRCCNLFTPVRIKKEHLLKWFQSEVISNKDVFFKEDDGNVCSISESNDGWAISIHSKFLKVEGMIHYVHELQNLLVDCGLNWL